MPGTPTITALYDRPPRWLRDAHGDLNVAVRDAHRDRTCVTAPSLQAVRTGVLAALTKLQGGGGLTFEARPQPLATGAAHTPEPHVEVRDGLLTVWFGQRDAPALAPIQVEID
jgi:hypothetical protein